MYGRNTKLIFVIISAIAIKHGLEEEIIDPLDSPEPYVSPDIINESVINSQQRVATVPEKSKPRYVNHNSFHNIY